MKRNLKLILDYDGTGFHGFQKQPGLSTVQGEVEKALGTVFKGRVATKGAGRTDAGVHATHQVLSFRVGTGIQLPRLTRSLNGILDDRIRARNIRQVPEEFHARRSAVSKEYTYYIVNRFSASPFRCRFAHWEPRPLDLRLIREAAGLFVGAHDFSAFSIHSPDKPDRVRTVRRIEVGFEDGWAGPAVAVRVEAASFLHRMVRLMVGTFMRVGLGLITPEEAGRMLEDQDKEAAGPSAPAKGLFLTGVRYSGADVLEGAPGRPRVKRC